MACLLAAALFFCAPFLENLKFLADDPDWHIQATMHASVRRTILEFEQFPFRSPFVGGGFPTFGHPEDPTLSPFILPTLLFGEV
ncbi:MAG: hypothetical protein FJ279_24670, partial [Planctomycetes bacterium]|nr:hypothetical protein [Planctomycetota bacterium]